MKLAVVQINPLVGDVAGNTRLILDALKEAERQGATLAIVSELALTGYPPRDLLDFPELLIAQEKALEAIQNSGNRLTIVCGFVEKNPSPIGKPFYNSAAVFFHGKKLGTYRKRLLPYYDVFEDERYFEPGSAPLIFEWGGKRVGVAICEDVWNASGFLGRDYSVDPLAEYIGKLDLLVVPSASPYDLGKQNRREALLKSIAKRLGCAVVLANQVGATDELIFDGHSLGVDKSGVVALRAPGFVSGVFSWGHDSVWEMGDQELALALQLGIRDYVRKSGAKKAILGLSGGIDSSVVAVLSVRALGAENVEVVALPSRFTSDASNQDAETLARALGLTLKTVSIEAPFAAFQEGLKGISGLALENLQPRIRMTVLMALSNQKGALLLNTSNKSEIAAGYSTLYGDSTGALGVLGDLTKNQVYALAKALNQPKELIPARVLERAPSAELRENQKDEDSLPPYAILDKMVDQLVTRPVEGLSEFDPVLATKFASLYRGSEYKRRQMPPVLRVSRRAFGMGRRIPVAAAHFPQKP